MFFVYGEVIEYYIDIFDREKVFIDKYLLLIVSVFLVLKVVFEYIIIVDVVSFVKDVSDFVGVMIML